jgi:hypothetical protein
VSTKWHIDLLGSKKFIFVSLEPRQDDIQEARIIMYKKLINFITIYLKGLY